MSDMFTTEVLDPEAEAQQDDAPTPPAADPPAADPQADPAADPAAEGEKAPATNEAAKYRVRLREAEAQNTALSEQVTSAKRAVLSALGKDVMADPLALVDRLNVPLDSLINDAMEVDVEALNGAAEAFRQAMATPFRAPSDPSQGKDQGGVSYGAPMDPLAAALANSR